MMSSISTSAELHVQLEGCIHHYSNKIQISALTGGGQPEFAGNLYTYLVQKPQYSTNESRKALVRRLREALVKCVSIIGVCKPLEAVFSIDAVEKPEDKDYSFSRYVVTHSCKQG